jgi:hypothetical protein
MVLLVGFAVGATKSSPEPLIETVEFGVAVIESEVFAAAIAVGVKVTCTEQLAPAARVLPHVVVLE